MTFPKTNRRSAAALVLPLALALSAACGSNSPSLCGDATGTAAFTANGVQYGSACATSTWGTGSGGPASTLIVFDPTGNYSISVVLPYPPAAGSYSLDQDGTGYAPSFAEVEASDGGIVSGLWITNSGNTGTAVVTSFDATSGLAKGTFSFTAAPDSSWTVDPLVVTEGSFSVVAVSH